MRIAAIHYERGYDIDRMLINVCRMLTTERLRIGGLVQLSTGERGGNCAATTHIVDLRTGEKFDIWEDRGPCARGCRLDEAGLAHAEPALQLAIDERVDLLVINRFGRAESLGRGLRTYFEAALATGVPVLTGVRAPYDKAWREFHGGLGAELACTATAAFDWTMRDAMRWSPNAITRVS